ncbi:MAG: VCBS repeat-containing protein, partial [Kiritimatiellae bacterium]|nr:VCBS repeat-containing protein [Kiritimatiellia bacterium]
MYIIFIAYLMAAIAGPVRFERHDIADFRAGYQLAIADMNGDSRPDVVALATDANRVEWFENPTWKSHPVSQTTKNIDLAPYDIDGDGQIDLAL